ncbi:MAG: GNAT family N-acetyltransferase [Lachnospiraceae bacterium]|nr:GNAT family N-acetyltransferase [Lachnospiraceae bacterium]
MEDDIKTIEDLSLNAWPSHQMEVYDGWILRFSYFYTHRTNCVEQIGVSCLPLDEKIEYCERMYRRWQTPCIFKISPIGNPLLDSALEERGYEIQHRTTVMTKNLREAPLLQVPPTDLPIHIENQASYAWIEGLFTLKHTTNIIHRRIVPSMYAAIPKDEIAVSIQSGERIVATGLGICDRDYVGVYAIHVAEEYRRRGYATAIVTTILKEARRMGASHAYLQVVTDNAPAKTVYRGLGFREQYRYFFRVGGMCL